MVIHFFTNFEMLNDKIGILKEINIIEFH